MFYKRPRLDCDTSLLLLLLRLLGLQLQLKGFSWKRAQAMTAALAAVAGGRVGGGAGDLETAPTTAAERRHADSSTAPQRQPTLPASQA